MMFKQIVLSAAMTLSTAMASLLDSSAARADPRDKPTIERSQWPMGSDRATIVRSYLHTAPIRIKLVVHKLTTWRTSARHQESAGLGAAPTGVATRPLAAPGIGHSSSLGFVGH